MNRYEELEMELKSIDKRKKEINEEMKNILKRPESGGGYYFIDNGMNVMFVVNIDSQRDIETFEGFNYFKTKEEAQAMADKFKAMLKECKTNPKKDLYIKCRNIYGKEYYGKLGDKTNIVYKDGSEAHVGDIVSITSKDSVTSLYHCGYTSLIFKTKNYEYGAVMGYATDIKEFNARYNIVKVKDWSELESGHKYKNFEDAFITSEPPMTESLED